jgi:ribosome recycling factor
MLKEAFSEGEVSEDDQRNGQKKIQDLTDRYIASVDQISESKEKELMEV